MKACDRDLNSKGIGEVGIFQFSVLDTAKALLRQRDREESKSALAIKSMGIKKSRN